MKDAALGLCAGHGPFGHRAQRTGWATRLSTRVHQPKGFLALRIALLGAGTIEIPPQGYGAVERVIWELSQALQRRGHETVVLNKPHGGEYRFALWARRELSGWGAGRPEVVHVQTTGVGYLFSKLGPEFIYTSHSPYWIDSRRDFSARWGRHCERAIARKARGFIALSGRIAQAVSKVGGHAPQVIPNGIDADQFSPLAHERTGKTVLSVGKISRVKAYDVVAKAIQGLPGTYYVLGDVQDKEYAEELEEYLQVHVIRNPSNEEIRKRMARADVFAHPSRSEAFSIAVLEGMASGLPIVGSEFCQDQVDGNGIIIEGSTVEGFRDALRDLLTDPQRRERMALRSRALAVERFSWDKVAEQVERVYQAVLDG